MNTAIFKFVDVEFEVTSLKDENEEIWVLANPFAKILGYSNCPKAVSVHVSQENQRTLEGLPSQYGKAVNRVKAGSKFINQAGLFELIQASRMPKAKEFRAWVNSDLLVKLCKTGKYNMINDASEKDASALNAINVVTSSTNSNAQWMDEFKEKYFELQQKMVSLQMESVRKDVQIAQKDTQIMEIRKTYDVQIAQKDTQIMEIQKNNEFKVMELRKDNECRLLELRQYYERQLSEYKLTIERLLVQANTNLTHIGVNALLAKENIEQNDELRGVLKVAGDRVVPELSERPEKEPYVTTYKRKVNENTRFRITRNQLAEVEACDRMTKRFQEAAEEPDAKKPRSKHYGWLKDSEKFLQIKCPNPVSLWIKIRNTYPHVFYGLKFVTKIKTEIEFLNEDQLRAKYHDNVRMCERNLKRDERKIAEFKRFGLTSADDAVEKCLTPSVCAKDRVSEIINNVIAQIREEFKPPEAARRFENTSEYTVDQVFNGFKMYANVVNFGSIINYYNWTPPPDAPPQQQQQQQSQQSPFPVSSLPSIVASPPVKREPAASAAAADFSSARL